MKKLFLLTSTIISILLTGAAKIPVNNTVISCPVNFELLSGKITDANYNEVTFKTNIKVKAPATKKEAVNKNKPPVKKAANTGQGNNTINLAGTILGISNDATQKRLDKKYKEFVNWGSKYTENKLVDG